MHGATTRADIEILILWNIHTKVPHTHESIHRYHLAFNWFLFLKCNVSCFHHDSNVIHIKLIKSCSLQSWNLLRINDGTFYGIVCHLNPTGLNIMELIQRIYSLKSWFDGVHMYSVQCAPFCIEIYKTTTFYVRCTTHQAHALNKTGKHFCCMYRWWVSCTRCLPDSSELNDRKIKLNINLAKQYECVWLGLDIAGTVCIAYRKAFADAAHSNRLLCMA